VERRSFLGVLAAAGVLGLAGCTDTAPTPGPTGGSTTPAPSPGGDDELRQATADAEQQLITMYAIAIATADTEVAERLRELQAQHVEHAQRLLPGREVSTSPPLPTASQPDSPSSPTGTTAPTGTGSPGPAVSAPRVVLAGLRRAELVALDQRRAACVAATAPELVRSLCLIAASEAQHAEVLAALRVAQTR
jgi:hypothetical protein